MALACETTTYCLLNTVHLCVFQASLSLGQVARAAVLDVRTTAVVASFETCVGKAKYMSRHIPVWSPDGMYLLLVAALFQSFSVSDRPSRVHVIRQWRRVHLGHSIPQRARVCVPVQTPNARD